MTSSVALMQNLLPVFKLGQQIAKYSLTQKVPDFPDPREIWGRFHRSLKNTKNRDFP